MNLSDSGSDEITTFDQIDPPEVRIRPEPKRRKKKQNMSVIGTVAQAQDTISLSGTLKRGLKMGSNPMDGRNLNNTLRRELKTSVSAHTNSLRRGESLYALDTREDIPVSPRSPKWGRSGRKKKKDEDTISISSNFSLLSPRSPKPGRDKYSRPDDSIYAYDDTVSMLEGLLTDTDGIKPEEGIRDTIGRKMSVTLKKMVKLERNQGDKVDAKVLTLTPDRCLILGVKAPFKVEINFHFLEIKAMDSPTPDRLNISTTNGRIYFLQMIGTDDADHIIGRVALSLRTIFPGVSLSKIMKASLEPLSRQKLIQSMLNQADMQESGPCGNFSVMYETMCNLMDLPVKEEVGWDVDTIYLSQNCKELNLKDFDLPDQKDFIPIISVLIYNRWFQGLVIRNIRLHNDVFDAILSVVRKSTVLRELCLEGVGMKGEVAHRLSQEMVENKECCIEVLDLSNNPLEDRAIMHLSGALPLLRQGGGLKTLKLDRTGLSAKGVSGLCQALRSSPVIGRTLSSLTLADNSIKGEEAIGLYNYLSTKNHLEYLDASGTDCAVEIYISAMSKGCLDNLKTINLSRNHFFGKGTSSRHPHYLEEEYTGNRKHKETALPNTFQEFFKTTKALGDLDLSGMKIPPEAVRQIMDGLAQNFNEDLQVTLNMSSAELKAPGAQMISAAVAHLTNLVGLDLSDNGLDSELPTLLGWIQQNHSIRTLKIGRNFNNIKPKYMKAVMDSVVQLVQEEGSCLEDLSLCDSKLRDWTTILLGCLGSNTSLTTLDISGNFMLDSGARNLAKALQINSKIRTLYLDRNMLTAAGYHEIAIALEKNYTLRFMPYPVNDVVASMKNQPERTQASMAKIQDLLLRNANTNKNSHDQQFRLQRAVTSTAQEVLDRVAEKVDDAVNALELLESDTATNDVVIKAKGLVKDAKNSRQLLSDIYGLGMEKTAGDHSQLKRKLDQMAKDMDTMVQDHIKSTVLTMTKNAEAQCPNIFKNISDVIEENTKERSSLPEDFVKNHVMRQTGSEIINKVSELNLLVATLISDKVNDTLLAALSQCNTTLTEQLNKRKQERLLTREEYKRPASEVLEQNGVSHKAEAAAEKEDDDVTPGEKGESGKKPSAAENILPAMRQERAASIAKRKQRPISSAAYDLDYKNKTEPQPSSPRSVSPIKEPDDVPVAAEKSDKSKGKHDEDVEKKQEPEPVYATVTKKRRESEGDKEEKDKEPCEEMVKEDESREETKEEPDGRKDDIELPELPATSSKKLQHVTKGRARPPRKHHAKPTKTEAQTDAGVDDFFTASVQSTDFDKVPTLAEEKEAEKEETKKTPKRLPGMGGMAMSITPEMLKRKSKRTAEPEEKELKEEKEPISPKPDEPKADQETEEAKNGEAEEKPRESASSRRKPAGAMGLPGMGMGGDILAEMKLKKLNRSKGNDTHHEKNGDSKPEGGQSPFGPSILRKKPTTSPGADKKEVPVNNNNNNNKEWTQLKATPNRLKSKSFERQEKPDIHLKPTNKPLMPPTKPSPPPAAAKPSSLKGKPPPLPSKPKPTAKREEFIDPKNVPSSVRLRAESWGKKDKTEGKK